MVGRIGIRSENKDRTERRAPLVPAQVRELVETHGLEVVVRPAPNRVFPIDAYRDAGATIMDDLTSCNVILGVKEVPEERFLPEQAYCFFSHTIKGQPQNMPMLSTLLDRGCSLIDYEKITDEEGRRLVLFGKFAGYAGMINSLWALGKRLQWEGIRTPFASLKQAKAYATLEEARAAVSEIGARLKSTQLPEEISPLICGFTGSGHVSKGAMAIFDLLQPVSVSPESLPEASRVPSHHAGRQIFKVHFERHHRMRPIDRHREFDAEEAILHPERYENCFEPSVPYLTILINGIYWEAPGPKLVRTAFLERLYAEERRPRLRIVGDITNDIGGSIEFNVQATHSDDPVYVYSPATGGVRSGWEGDGPVILAVDKLPSELPVESSTAFGAALMPFVPGIARADFGQALEDLVLPGPIKRALIAHKGRLTPGFGYLQSYLAS